MTKKEPAENVTSAEVEKRCSKLLGSFKNEKTEAQRHKVTCPRLHSPKPEMESGSPPPPSPLSVLLRLAWGTSEGGDPKEANLRQVKETAVKKLWVCNLRQ